MKRIFNGLFYGLKFLLLIAAFTLSLFIFLRMNMRLDKSFVSVLPQFIPFVILLILFIVNMLFKQEGVTKCLFYNLTCSLVLTTIVLVSLRAIMDTNMVLNGKYGYGIDFNFFDNFLAYIDIMVYGLIISNILFMFKEKDNIKDEKIESDKSNKSKRFKKA